MLGKVVIIELIGVYYWALEIRVLVVANLSNVDVLSVCSSLCDALIDLDFATDKSRRKCKAEFNFKILRQAKGAANIR